MWPPYTLHPIAFLLSLLGGVGYGAASAWLLGSWSPTSSTLQLVLSLGWAACLWQGKEGVPLLVAQGQALSAGLAPAQGSCAQQAMHLPAPWQALLLGGGGQDICGGWAGVAGSSPVLGSRQWYHGWLHFGDKKCGLDRTLA